MNMIKKVVVIGFGEMGKRHALEFRESTQGRIEIAGVFEPDDHMYRRGCQWNSLEIPRFQGIKEMLDKVQPDGALITSPNHRHLENLLEFEGRDLPVLLEKPLDTSMESVARIVRFARDYAGIIVVDHVMRYAPIIRRAKQMVESGRLGRLASFQFSQRTNTGPFHTFRRSIRGGGSQMIEKATHDLDVMLYLCDARPDRVAMISKQQLIGGNKPNDLRCHDCDELLDCPSSKFQNMAGRDRDVNIQNDLCVFAEMVDVPDNEACLIELENGVFGTYTHNYFSNMKGHSRLYELIGTEGALHLQLSAQDPGYRGVLRYFPNNSSGEVEAFSYDYYNRIHYNGGPYLARHFYNVMCGTETTAFTTVNQAFVAEALGFAAMKAAREERFVAVDSIVPEDLEELFLSTYRRKEMSPQRMAGFIGMA